MRETFIVSSIQSWWWAFEAKGRSQPVPRSKKKKKNLVQHVITSTPWSYVLTQIQAKERNFKVWLHLRKV